MRCCTCASTPARLCTSVHARPCSHAHEGTCIGAGLTSQCHACMQTMYLTSVSLEATPKPSPASAGCTTPPSSGTTHLHTWHCSSTLPRHHSTDRSAPCTCMHIFQCSGIVCCAFVKQCLGAGSTLSHLSVSGPCLSRLSFVTKHDQHISWCIHEQC